MTSTAGFTRTEVKVLLVVTAVLTAAGMVYLRLARIEATWGQCGRNLHQIAEAQFDYSIREPQGSSESYLRGTEWKCRASVRTPGTGLRDGTLRTDGSRAFLYLAKKGYLDLETLVCPADPFAAGLPASALLPGDLDFPDENAPLAVRWTGPGATARGPGQTFYSYSMQAGSTDVQINFGPKMLATLPLAADRNPWSEPLPTLTGMDPTAGGFANGNSWNHNREGQIYARRDGTVFRLDDARRLEMPLTPASRPAAGFDYIYGDDPVSAAPSSSAALPPPPYTGVGSNQPPRAASWGCFLFD